MLGESGESILFGLDVISCSLLRDLEFEIVSLFLFKVAAFKASLLRFALNAGFSPSAEL